MGEMYPPTTADYAMAGVDDAKRRLEKLEQASPVRTSSYVVPMAPELSREQRRERIAMAILQGCAASNRTLWDEHGPMLEGQIARTVLYADALIAELDK